MHSPGLGGLDRSPPTLEADTPASPPKRFLLGGLPARLPKATSSIQKLVAFVFKVANFAVCC